MTRVQALGVLLIALGLIYALLYFGWLRRARRRASAVVAAAATERVTTSSADAAGYFGRVDSAPSGIGSADSRPARAMTMAWVEGTFISTTMAISRHERIASPGMGMRVSSTMVVDESSVRWERDGTSEVRVEGNRLLGVSLRRGRAGGLLGRSPIVVVSWHADNGDRYATAFLPRHRVETADLVRAVQRLMTSGATVNDATVNDATVNDATSSKTPAETGTTTPTEFGARTQHQPRTTPEGTP